MNKRLIPPVRYDTGEKFDFFFDKPEVVDIIASDSGLVLDENADLNDSGQEQNEFSAANDGESNVGPHNFGLLPWVPRSVEYSRERRTPFVSTKNDN